MSKELKTKHAPFLWDAHKDQAALLLAQDRRDITAIAAECGTTKQTLWRWQQREEFQARIAEIRQMILERAMQEGIAQKDRRLKSYQDDWEATEQILRERGANLAEKGHGAASGFMVWKQKVIGSGDSQLLTDELEFDSGLFKARLEIRKQMAVERREWTEQKDVTVNVGLGERLIAARKRVAAPPPNPGLTIVPKPDPCSSAKD